VIHNALHRNPVPLDREKHRTLRVDRAAMSNYTPMVGLNSYFINAVEFADAGREYPIVFVRASAAEAGKPMEVAPVAVFGLAPGENLFVDASGHWNSSYIPAQLRAYPFALARVDEQQYTVCIDRTWQGLSDTADGPGTPLFEADGQPSGYMEEMRKYLETLEMELQRTRQFCARLVELGLLQDMRFDATLPDGNKLSVDGFLSIEEKKLRELPDADVIDLHRNGLLALLHLQQASIRNMRRLLDRRMQRTANA
jgi:hypothetical protein